MKIVVLGGTGRIGARVAALLTERGHEVVAASRSTGVDAVAGTGLDDAFAGADVVVDATESSAWDEAGVIEFFTTATGNVLAAEQRAGVAHHVALSIVGIDRNPEARGYLAGKVVQERLVTGSPVPSTIVRATQFFEFLPQIADASTVDGAVRVGTALLQPVAADAVALALADAAEAPVGGAVDVAGPERAPLAEFLRRDLAVRGDARRVVVDPAAGYFGRVVGETSLVPAGEATVDTVTYKEWLLAR
ncbi:NAD(P)H-binding protein [Microbacterium sp. NEAU-LLC]|uniref:NAD(P)H-binding protein n=1 Tax=Microbacterium helvum TaxID=2773713 RepID=A0ABR8NSY9_9MICO|nr:NAD(P)H-binding protein [Microbacterium helvum]MBD3942146.1 NAD(P)H-binding protein [Microbacterium helvum]